MLVGPQTYVSSVKWSATHTYIVKIKVIEIVKYSCRKHFNKVNIIRKTKLLSYWKNVTKEKRPIPLFSKKIFIKRFLSLMT